MCGQPSFFEVNPQESSEGKRCSGLCGRFRPLKEFHRNTSMPDGHQTDCIHCQKARKHNPVLYDGLKKQVDLERKGMSRAKALQEFQRADKTVTW